MGGGEGVRVRGKGGGGYNGVISPVGRLTWGWEGRAGDKVPQVHHLCLHTSPGSGLFWKEGTTVDPCISESLLHSPHPLPP